MKLHRSAPIWNAIGAFSYLALHALSIALIARLAGAEAVGIYLLAQAVGFPLSRLSGLNYHDINATELAISGLRQHLANVALVSLPLTILAIVLWVSLTEGPLRAAGPPLIVANVLQGYAQVSQGRLVRLQHYRAGALFEILRGVAAVLCFIIGIVWFGSLASAAWLLSLVWCCIVALELHRCRHLSAQGCRPESAVLPDTFLSLFERLRYAFSDSMTSLQGASVRLLTGAILGEIAVGILGATALLTRLIQPAAASCSKTFLPRLAEGLATGRITVVRHQYARIHQFTLLMTAVFCCLGYWATPPLVEFFLGAALRPPALVAGIIMAGTAPLIGSRFLTQILIALRARKAIERATFSSFVGTLMLGPVLIMSQQLTGAALALTLGFLIRYTLAARYANQVIAERERGRKHLPDTHPLHHQDCNLIEKKCHDA